MSKKKRMQEKAEAERRAAAQQKRLDRQIPGVIYGPAGPIVPAAPATPIIQLPPIVQPVVMVPFSSQMQPIATFDDDFDDEDDLF